MADMANTNQINGQPRVAKGDSEASIDGVNQWMRSQPWYREFLASVGQNPNSVKLNDPQKAQLMQLAQANGVQIDQGNIEVDPGGNFNPKGHKLRNGLIAAAIGGAAALTGGAALGAFGGAGGAGAGAGAAGAAGAASAAPALAAGIPTAIGGASALPAIGGLAAAGGATGLGAATAGGLLPSVSTVGTAALPSAAGSSLMGASTGGGLLSSVGGFLGKNKDLIGAVGKGIGDATSAAGQNRINADELGIRGTAAYESELNNRARTDADQRGNALKDVYRASWYGNRQASPNNTRGLTPVSDQFSDTLKTLATQGEDRLKVASPYNMNTVNPLPPYAPTKAGLLEKVGGWAGPILGVANAVLNRKK